eukprot:776283-Rhodomonas_salina.2
MLWQYKTCWSRRILSQREPGSFRYSLHTLVLRVSVGGQNARNLSAHELVFATGARGGGGGRGGGGRGGGGGGGGEDFIEEERGGEEDGEEEAEEEEETWVLCGDVVLPKAQLAHVCEEHSTLLAEVDHRVAPPGQRR